MAKGNAAPKVESRGPAPVSPGAATRALDRIIHERLRLGIVSALSVNHSLTFNELKKLLDTTDRPVTESVDQVEQWITEQRDAHRTGQLSLGPGWAS